MEEPRDEKTGRYYFAAEANDLVTQLRERNAALERGIKAIQDKCAYRALGMCDLDCPGRVFCDINGLESHFLTRSHDDEDVGECANVGAEGAVCAG